MNKYPLIGVSICAVVLLVLGSLTNVVGYQSVKSTAINDSPLFRTRTQRATNQHQNIITSQYLGKGIGNLLQFPIRDNRTESLIKAIEFISKMDDNTFNQFTELCIQQARQDNTLSKKTPNEITQMLQLLRTKSETITHSLISGDDYNRTSNNLITICHWVPYCIPKFILVPIIIIILAGFFFITVQFSCLPTNGPESICLGRCINR